LKKLLPTLLIVSLCYLCSCNSDASKQVAATNKNDSTSLLKVLPVDTVYQIDRSALTKDFVTWYNYTYYNVPLSADFIGLDTDSTVINKEAFLNKLLKGDVVPFKIRVVRDTQVYKLYTLNENKESIEPTLKQMAEWEMKYFKMEGKEMPQYNITDLDGKTYSNASTKGNIVLFKCWFIGCVACVKEFPELNRLVEENRGNKDVLFISLAFDSAQNLKNFLKTKEFKYAVVPGAKNLIHKMNIVAYPTHLLIDRNGKIIKVVNRIEELIPFLNKEKLKAEL
jgi:thiol-disulfide isomerase/thioredoxin